MTGRQYRWGISSNPSSSSSRDGPCCHGRRARALIPSFSAGSLRRKYSSSSRHSPFSSTSSYRGTYSAGQGGVPWGKAGLSSVRVLPTPQAPSRITLWFSGWLQLSAISSQTGFSSPFLMQPVVMNRLSLPSAGESRRSMSSSCISRKRGIVRRVRSSSASSLAGSSICPCSDRAQSEASTSRRGMS